MLATIVRRIRGEDGAVPLAVAPSDWSSFSAYEAREAPPARSARMARSPWASTTRRPGGWCQRNCTRDGRRTRCRPPRASGPARCCTASRAGVVAAVTLPVVVVTEVSASGWAAASVPSASA